MTRFAMLWIGHRRRRSVPASVLALLCLALLAQLPAMAKGKDALVHAEPVTAGQRLTLHSSILGEDRELLVHLPEGYETSIQRYPVLFVLDGNRHFLYASGMVDFLAEAGRAPEMIVVAIPTQQRRMRDMTVPRDYKAGAAGEASGAEPARPASPGTAGAASPASLEVGGADGFVGFLADELIPWLDTHYRTEPFHILTGHSLGGLFNVESLLRRPDVFQAHIAASPSLWWAKRALVQEAKDTLPGIHGPHFLYMSWSDDETDIRDSVQELTDWLRKTPLPDLKWQAHYYPGYNHDMTPLRTLLDGLEWLFADWKFELPHGDDQTYAQLDAAIKAHYSGLSKQFGYTVPIDGEVQYNLASWLMEHHQQDQALATARDNVARHPNNEMLLSQLSDILEKTGQPVQALAVYRQAMKHRHEYGNYWQSQRRLKKLEDAAKAATHPARSSNPA